MRCMRRSDCGSSMASLLSKSLLKAGWAWSHEMLNLVLSDLRAEGVNDAHAMIGALRV